MAGNLSLAMRLSCMNGGAAEQKECGAGFSVRDGGMKRVQSKLKTSAVEIKNERSRN
jgi:hypothetical protein